MFYGVQITSGLENWQVLQRHGGAAKVTVKGRWQLEEGAIRAGVRSATVVTRLVRENDQSWVWPWRACSSQTNADRLSGDEVKGEWTAELQIPEGGLYRLETSLDAVSAQNGDHWMFRGDIRTHIGVGDVFCIAGQSNAAGYAKGFAYDPPDPRVHLLRNSGIWDMATHPMNDATDASDCLNAPMSVTGTSPFLSFGRRYADVAGVPVGLLMAAQGGSPIARWDPNRNGDLWRNMMRKIGPGGDVRAILWYQGCADADKENAALYAQSFGSLVRSTREAARWDIPFFTMQLNRYETQPDAVSWARIKEDQRQAAQAIPKVWILPTSSLALSDEIHNSASGNVVLGEMLAKQVHGALNAGTPFEAPALSLVHCQDGMIEACFSHASSLASLRPLHDLLDFALEDEEGRIGIEHVTVLPDRILLKPKRNLKGSAFLSYGADPKGPEGSIVDLSTFLPLICFTHVEVSR